MLYIQPAVTIGGAERQASLLLQALEQVGVEATCVTGPGEDIVAWFVQRGVPRFRRSAHFPGTLPLGLGTLPEYLRLTLALVDELDELHRERPFDAVIGSLGYGWAVAGILGRRWGVPAVWRAGGCEITRAEELGVRFLPRVVPPALMWCNAAAVATFWRRRLALPARVVPNGVRLPSRPRMRLPHASLEVGFAGRLVPQKNLPTLLRAIARLRSHGIPARLRIATPGPREQVELMCAAAGLELDAVRLLGKVEDMEGFYRRLDVFALPSNSEGCANVLMEAMSFGVPVVASAVGGTPELVRDGREGLLVPARDPAALARALEALWRDPARARRLGLAGRLRASEYPPERSARALADLLFQLCGRERREEKTTPEHRSVYPNVVRLTPPR